MSPAPLDSPPIALRIGRARAGLTRAHQRLADYVLTHPLPAATMPIDELASAVGVSVATANRFARAIGLDGYPMLRAELVRGFEAMLAPVEKMRLRVGEPSSTHEVFAASLEQNQRNIAATRKALDPAACDAAVQRILTAKRVYLAGFGASSWLAGLLQFGLDSHCNTVQLLANMAGPTYGARLLPRMNRDDLLISLAFPRYLSDTLCLTRAARQRGVQVLALTDSPQSPLAAHADVCLFAHTENAYAANSESTVLALIEALTSAVAHRASDAVQSAARVTEAALPWLLDGDAPRAARRNLRKTNNASKH